MSDPLLTYDAAEQRLHLAVAGLRRTWLLDAEGLHAEALSWQGRDWLRATGAACGGRETDLRVDQAQWRSWQAPLSPVGASAWQGELVVPRRDGEAVHWQFAVVDGLPAVWLRTRIGQRTWDAAAHGPPPRPTGVEEVFKPRWDKLCPLAEDLVLATPHLMLRRIELHDQTDATDNLVQEHCWRLGPIQRHRLQGCLFSLHDPLARQGLAILRLEALPQRRPLTSPWDVECSGVRWRLSIADGPAAEWSDWWALGAYSGEADGAGCLVQAMQQALRSYRADRDGLLMANTWGDRNKDARLDEDFMQAEIAAAAELGLDGCQIDDGWQQGTTSNSSAASASNPGVWNDYYDTDPDFWAAHPERFPRGLAPVCEAARQRGQAIGIWFSPDSSDDFANWQRDRDRILALHRDLGIEVVKIDGVKVHSLLAQRRLERLHEELLAVSDGRISFDFDITAEQRPGYFGLVAAGPLWLENRYTDWGRWWPHATFRNLWQLARWIPPLRLRMEWLNHRRNPERYDADDALAPRHYDAAFCFAQIMIASPLLFAEASGMHPDDRAAVAPLIATWKRWRHELHAGLVSPIGPDPDGSTTSGFLVSARDGSCVHVLLYRFLDVQAQHCWTCHLPAGQAQRLAGSGKLTASDAAWISDIPDQRAFGWWRITDSGR